jgi:hypothetical protein
VGIKGSQAESTIVDQRATSSLAQRDREARPTLAPSTTIANPDRRLIAESQSEAAGNHRRIAVSEAERGWLARQTIFYRGR